MSTKTNQRTNNEKDKKPNKMKTIYVAPFSSFNHIKLLADGGRGSREV